MPAAAFHEVYTECMRRALEEHFRKAFAGLLASRWWKDAGNPNE